MKTFTSIIVDYVSAVLMIITFFKFQIAFFLGKVVIWIFKNVLVGGDINSIRKLS